MAPFVHREVARDRAHPIGLGWNDGHGASAVQFGADPVDVEGLVGQQGLEVDPLDQRRNADAVVALAGKQQEAASGCRAHRRARRFSSSARLAIGRWPDFESPPCAGAMLVDPDDGAVDDGVFEVRVGGQQLE